MIENAGHAVASVVQNSFPEAGKILVLCGIVNNGGDGFIAARLLQYAGIKIKVDISGDIVSAKQKQDTLCKPQMRQLIC